MIVLRFILLLFLWYCTTSCGPTKPKPTIEHIQITDLGTLPGGTSSTATDINNKGTVVGYSTTPYGFQRGFSIKNGSMRDLGTLPEGNTSRALGVNDLDQIVGHSNKLNHATNNLVIHAVLWEDGAPMDLGAFPPEDGIDSSSNAYAINNKGLIAGHIDLSGGVWDLNGKPEFPPFTSITEKRDFTPTIAVDINDQNQVAGQYLSRDQALIRWHPSTDLLEDFAKVKTEGEKYDNAHPSRMNQEGAVVGYVLHIYPIADHAAFWPNPHIGIDLGTLGGDTSKAMDINGNFTIVGYSETAAGHTEAFIWHTSIGTSVR